ncbi:hypothetical protein O181_049781 [Austropuccinia psidii MF-1]|uniref:Uncharacterized protein n=1 Tax=Austropuccinia psidii MF-1 TaxID=1389203 RepID=A0A9Q3E0K2_9BASI|nr:hypothetical protein [Austropuccinia psidii MF-1]
MSSKIHQDHQDEQNQDPLPPNYQASCHPFLACEDSLKSKTLHSSSRSPISPGHHDQAHDQAISTTMSNHSHQKRLSIDNLSSNPSDRPNLNHHLNHHQNQRHQYNSSSSICHSRSTSSNSSNTQSFHRKSLQLNHHQQEHCNLIHSNLESHLIQFNHPSTYSYSSTSSSGSSSQSSSNLYHLFFLSSSYNHSIQPLLSISILISLLLINSITSSIILAIVTTRLTHLSLATFPALELFSLSILTRLKPITSLDSKLSNSNHYFNSNHHHHHHHHHHPTNHHLPKLFSWRFIIKYTLPISLLSLSTSWSKAELAGRLGIGIWQSFDVYSLPIVWLILSKKLLLRKPSKEFYAAGSLIAASISLILFNQSFSPIFILLGSFSALSHATYLISLKTFQLSFPQISLRLALTHSSPLAFILVIIPAFLNSTHRSTNGIDSLGTTPPSTLGTSFWLISFVLARVSERMLELWTIQRLRSPLSILLLISPRNLLSIGLSSLTRVYIGLTSLPQALTIYFLSLLGIHHAETGIMDVILVFIHLIWKRVPPKSYVNTPLIMEYDQDDEDDQDEEDEEDDERKLNYNTEEHQENILDHSNEALKQNRFQNSTHLEGSLLDQEIFRLHNTRFALSIPRPSYRRFSATRTRFRWAFRISVFGPLIILFFLQSHRNSTHWESTRNELLIQTNRLNRSLDLVFSYYNEPLDLFAQAVNHVRTVSVLAAQNPQVIIYVKHPEISLSKVAQAIKADQVIRLNNVGREGGTYLTHILRHYNATLYSMSTQSINFNDLPQHFEFEKEKLSNQLGIIGLADHTIFMQPHISWHWIAKPRMTLFDSRRTGFLSFGPYLNSTCGEDGLGNGNYERMRDIYAIFHESFCPPSGQLASYAGQFLVSKKRIMKHGYSKYLKLKEILEAPSQHWIHTEGGWLKWKGATDVGPAKNPTGPVAPFLGHALERSWPVIFDCEDPSIAKNCPDEVNDKERCQCFDE